MYRHCIYCSAHLGANEALEGFPVGRTVAFDAAKGRLWAVCRKCARWNLAPIEERWSAVEEAERCFAGARMRVEGENVGLATLRDGTRLVRIGRAGVREMAAWRYGDELRRRQRFHQIAGVAGVAANAGLAVLALSGMLPLGVLAWSYARPVARAIQDRRPLHHLPPGPGRGGAMALRRMHLPGAWVVQDEGGLVLRLPEAPRAADGRMLVLRGDEARRVVEKSMLLVNRAGARPRELETAVDALSAADGADAYLRSAIGGGRVLLRHREEGGVASLGGAEAIAFEMALHEESERRALEGELALLESAWREAEEIAGIADRLAFEASAEAVR
jgi:hypothetical protein